MNYKYMTTLLIVNIYILCYKNEQRQDEEEGYSERT